MGSAAQRQRCAEPTASAQRGAGAGREGAPPAPPGLGNTHACRQAQAAAVGSGFGSAAAKGRAPAAPPLRRLSHNLLGGA